MLADFRAVRRTAVAEALSDLIKNDNASLNTVRPQVLGSARCRTTAAHKVRRLTALSVVNQRHHC